MSAIDDFAKTLTSTGHDDLLIVLQAMSDGHYRRRSQEIEQELASLVTAIDEVNSRREQLSGQRALLDRLLKKIDNYIHDHSADPEMPADLEMHLFRLHLSNQLDRLKVRIAETRPDDELKRKHDLTQERILLDAGRKVAIEVMRRVVKTESAR